MGVRHTHTAPGAEIALADGTRHVGMVCPRDGAYEAHSERAGYLGKHPTQNAARAAVLRADREHDAKQHRMADDAGVPA
jgi:hypothetical protein